MQTPRCQFGMLALLVAGMPAAADEIDLPGLTGDHRAGPRPATGLRTTWGALKSLY